ncbi:transposase [Candidatus Gottesmanbacteria bacterium]|nr:transposase [Candidatus Gottesmanbacteria bacterium]
MRLTMSERRSITRIEALRYQKARKKEKKMILDHFTYQTEYNRCYASYLLRDYGKKVKLRLNESQSLIITTDRRIKAKRIKTKTYDDKVLIALKNIWYIADCICGKRLAPLLEEIIPSLERFKEINLDISTRSKLLEISPATIDRLLAQERKKLTLKCRSKTKPGSLLKHQIPIKTFSEWDDTKPGFVQIDLVGHDGGYLSDDYLQTLDVSDVATAWTETQAVRNKAQIWVLQALQNIKKKLPFRLLGIDSDNGSEFINAHLWRYCIENQITFTRSRPYKKNDLCFVEQKNYSVVRKTVGYYRYDTEQELTLINQLYAHLRLYTNFFQPVMKLVEKTRIGSKVTKKYDYPLSPYKRVLKSSQIPQENKTELSKLYLNLNPAELKRKITNCQNKLLQLAQLKTKIRKKNLTQAENLGYTLPAEKGFYDGLNL